MRSKIVGSSGERPTVNEAVGGFSVFLASCKSDYQAPKLRFATCSKVQNFPA
jgi:hypothetical protein